MAAAAARKSSKEIGFFPDPFVGWSVTAATVAASEGGEGGCGVVWGMGKGVMSMGG